MNINLKILFIIGLFSKSIYLEFLGNICLYNLMYNMII